MRRILSREKTGRFGKRCLLFGLILLCITPLNGCWDRREVESLALVQVLGLDLAPDGKNINVSVTIAIPPKIVSVGGQGGGGSDTGAFTISMSAPSIYEAMNRINTTVNRDVTLLQNAVILIGEDLAKQGVRKWIDTLVRFREMRRTVLIVVCKGKAADVMAVKPKLEKNPAQYFRDLIGEYRKTGLFPEVRAQEFLNSFEAYGQEMYAPYLAKYQRQEPGQAKKGDQGSKGGQSGGSGEGGGGAGGVQGKKPSEGEDVRLMGTAIFKKDRVIGNFDIYESQVLLMLLGKFRQGFLTIRDPLKKGYNIAFRLLNNVPPAISYRREDGHDRFRVNLKFEVDLVSIQSSLDYTDPKLEKILGHRIALTLKNRIQKVLIKAQKEYDSDVFGFGNKVRESFLTDQEWVQYHWPDRFRDAQCDVNVKAALRRVGIQFQPPQNR